MAFKVGDIVESRWEGDDSYGWQGKIIGIEPWRVTVEFSDEFPRGHSANGLSSKRKGWFIEPQHLTQVISYTYPMEVVFTLEEITAYNTPEHTA